MSKYCFDWQCGLEVPHQHQTTSVLITGNTETQFGHRACDEEISRVRAELTQAREDAKHWETRFREVFADAATLQKRIAVLEELLGTLDAWFSLPSDPHETACRAWRVQIRRALSPTDASAPKAEEPKS